MNTESTNTLDWQDIISGWTFTCGGDEPPEGLAESVVPMVTRGISGAYEITTISFGFSETAPYYQQKFTATFSCSIKCSANLYSVRVSSDDTATVNVGEISAEATLHSLGEDETEKWISTPSDSLSLSGNYETVGGPYSLNVTIILKRSLRKLYLGFLYEPPTAKNPGLHPDYPISDRRRIGAGEEIAVWVRTKESESTVCDGLVSVEIVPLASGSRKMVSASSGEFAKIPGYCFVVEGETKLIANFSDGEKLEESVNVIFPSYQIGTEILEERKGFFVQETTDENTGEKKTITAQAGFTTQYKVKIFPQDVSFSGARFWECVGTKTATDFFAKFSEGTTHVPNTKLMAPGTENEWTDQVGFGVFKFPVDYFNTEFFSESNSGEILGRLIWTIPVRWTVLGINQTEKDIEDIENDERPYYGEISPYSEQETLCQKTEFETTDDSGLMWCGVGISITARKDFSPGATHNE